VEINKPRTKDNIEKEEDLDKTLVKDNTLMDKSNDIFTDVKEESFTHMDNDDSIPQRSERIHQEPDRHGEWMTYFAFSAEQFVGNKHQLKRQNNVKIGESGEKHR